MCASKVYKTVNAIVRPRLCPPVGILCWQATSTQRKSPYFTWCRIINEIIVHVRNVNTKLNSNLVCAILNKEVNISGNYDANGIILYNTIQYNAIQHNTRVQYRASPCAIGASFLWMTHHIVSLCAGWPITFLLQCASFPCFLPMLPHSITLSSRIIYSTK